MINEFLQFLKKQKLANHFARHDLLFLLRPLQTFRANLPLASLLRRPSARPPVRRVIDYLQKNPQSMAAVLAVRLALNYKTCPPRLPERILRGGEIFKTALTAKDRRSREKLLAELAARDWPDFDFGDLQKNLDLNLDMRLLAAELERLSGAAAEYPGCLKFAVNWPETSQERLVLDFSAPTEYTMCLKEKAQQNLAEIFFRLFYWKSLLVLDWPAIACDAEGKVAWLDFSLLKDVDSSLRARALDYLHRRSIPRTPAEHDLKRALDLLTVYCPQVDLTAMAEEISCCPLPEFTTDDLRRGAQTLKRLQQLGMSAGHIDSPAETSPQEIAYLLDSKRRLRESSFRKASFYYWGPLLLAAYALYYYF